MADQTVNYLVVTIDGDRAEGTILLDEPPLVDLTIRIPPHKALAAALRGGMTINVRTDTVEEPDDCY